MSNAPKFGTSGLRGLVTELTPELVASYVHAFLTSCPTGTGVFVGHDLRDSSDPIAKMVAHAVVTSGKDAVCCGPVPTPALALAAYRAEAAAIMVTGSHIPADRNGLKFYTAQGEITKEDETNIIAQLGAKEIQPNVGQTTNRTDVSEKYQDRYRAAFKNTLSGQKIGVYMHSAVGRDLLTDLLQDLGADVIALGRSDIFVPIDTEAVSNNLRQNLRKWAQIHHCDAIVSTDADGDRPLLTDEQGEVVPGDILGQITARSLHASTIVTPVSSNTGAEVSGSFDTVLRTKIGSPFVISTIQSASGDVVGYEANGGFLLGYTAKGPTDKIAPLMTRDALLPILSVLFAAKDDGVCALIAKQPARFTAADRLEGVNADRAKEFINRVKTDAAFCATFIHHFSSAATGIDETDGVRITLETGRIVHLRPSGNAPEFRLYVEAESKAIAAVMLSDGMRALSHHLKSS